MATISFPFAASGVTWLANEFISAPWTPSDSMVGTGATTTGIALLPNDGSSPFDLSTLGSIEGTITSAIVNYAHAGTYSTVGPGTNYDINAFDETHTQAEGASWSSSGAWDATAFFVSGPPGGDLMEGLPTYPWSVFGAGGNMEAGITFGYTISVLSIDFVYTPSGAVVTDVTPTHGDKAGGTVVTLTGTGFTGATSALFGATAGTGLVVASDTSATGVTPAHAVGQVTVTVA